MDTAILRTETTRVRHVSVTAGGLGFEELSMTAGGELGNDELEHELGNDELEHELHLELLTRDEHEAGVKGGEVRKDEEGEEYDHVSSLHSPATRPATTHTRPGTTHTRPETSKTDMSNLTVESTHLLGVDSEVVVRSLLNEDGGKGRLKYLGQLQPLSQLDHVTLRQMALQVKILKSQFYIFLMYCTVHLAAS